MNTKLKLSAVDDMGLDLCHVVGDIVNLVKLVIFCFTGQCLFETVSDMARQDLTVCKSIVGRPFHGRQIISALRTGERCANQLPVRQVKTISANLFLKAFDVVTAYLVAESARAAMNLNRNLIFKKPHAPGGGFI